MSPLQQLIPENGRQAFVLRSQTPWVKRVFIALTLFILGVLILTPLLVIFGVAFQEGVGKFVEVFSEPAARHAIKLTLMVVAISVPLNTIFGLALAWLIVFHEFRGKTYLSALVDIPISISPVIGGLVYVLLYGAQGWFGAWIYPDAEMLSQSALARFCEEWHVRIIFELPGIVLATLFVTLPYVARGLLPMMQQQGRSEEEVALTLGAGGLQTFYHVTLPKIKWALIYSVILCNARAMGEFGAVSVVSGHIRGRTNTIPLHIEILYNEYNYVGAFALACLLSLLAILTLLVKTVSKKKV